VTVGHPPACAGAVGPGRAYVAVQNSVPGGSFGPAPCLAPPRPAGWAWAGGVNDGAMLSGQPMRPPGHQGRWPAGPDLDSPPPTTVCRPSDHSLMYRQSDDWCRHGSSCMLARLGFPTGESYSRDRVDRGKHPGAHVAWRYRRGGSLDAQRPQTSRAMGSGVSAERPAHPSAAPPCAGTGRGRSEEQGAARCRLATVSPVHSVPQRAWTPAPTRPVDHHRPDRAIPAPANQTGRTPWPPRAT